MDGVEGVWDVGGTRVRSEEVRGLEALVGGGGGINGGKKGGAEGGADGDKMDTT